MRLTLRTMLAHMDGILEPEDDEDIRKKIADSEFATNLMHRIRDVVRRLRLGAPNLGGRGPGLDPNTVAEYLDNALPDDQVADFEKVCLESDMQLAEVAAAHQVLTLVLGEPVEIDPAARERMYRLPGVAAEGEKAAEVRRRERPGVPDYLREPPRKHWGLRTLAVVAVAGCVIVAVMAATGRLDPWLERVGLRTAEREVADVSETLEEPGSPAEPVELVPESPKQPEAPVEADPEPADPGVAVDQPVPPALPLTETEAEPKGEPVLPKAPLPDDVSEPGAVPARPQESAPLPDDVLRPAPLPGDAPATATESVPSAEKPGSLEPVTPPDATPLPPAADQLPDPAPLPMPGLPVPGMEEPVAPEGPAVPPERPERAPLGRLVSDRQLLLQFDPATGSWDRVAMQTAIMSEYPLLALPTYRPVVALTAGITVQLVGPVQVELHPINGDAMPMLEVVYGRLMMQTLGQAGSQLRLAIAGREGVITFAEAESGVAMHVYRVANPGDDPESNAAPLVADLWTTRGTITWQTDGGEPVVLSTSEGISLGSAVPESPEPKSAKLPAWVTGDQSSLIDKRASATLADEISADRPAALALREVAGGHRQREVRWLAVRCLGYLGQFDPLVAVFDDENSKAVWFEYIDEIRAAMAREPRLAAAVRESLQRHYRTDSEKLYRMLWGYSSEDLRAGAATTLVDDLEHERLAVRLLSFWNLREITGLGLFYRPEYLPAKRQQPVQRWRERLASGDIVRKAEERTEPEQ
ncbi:MAG: hypothetical protein RBS80_18290 [Thermoguttaceae bacterium]|nr:hypothetical protein [Thermoguttaceae bacterium]